MSPSFEVHATVGASVDADAVDRLCGAVGGRFLSLELRAQGSDPLRQGMVTFSTPAADPREVAASARSVAAAHGVEIVRVKVEAPPPSAWTTLYRESHVLVRAPGAFFASLPAEVAAVAATHGARMSRRARRALDDGPAERFFTRRDAEPLGAESRHEEWLAALRSALRAHPEATIVAAEEEAVLWDDHQALDEGWR